MPVHKINSFVFRFNHEQYGLRLLFRQGEANPRNQLGKNGITVHSRFESLFYKTITITANLQTEERIIENQKFILNRSSLIKYIGEKTETNVSDTELIEKLNAKMLTSDDLNKPSEADKRRQGEAGEHLRHAGEYHKQKINHSSLRSLVGNFLSWLYQKTIVSFNRFKMRFLFVRTEKDLFEAGETLAITRFHEAYAEVPAYKIHITTYNSQAIKDLSFNELPTTTKANYITQNSTCDFNTHRHGKYPKQAKIDTSTGTTGKPTSWVRSDQEVEVVKRTLALAAQVQLGDRRISYINAFAFGPWATGMTTYEFMRKTGSVFAAGPDKEKILEEMLRISRYEQAQLQNEVAQLCQRKTEISESEKQIISNLINATLNDLLKKPHSDLKNMFGQQLQKLSESNQSNIKKYKKEVLVILERLNQQKSQIVITGYPPFLKELADYIKTKNHTLSDFSAIGLIGGQGNSEAMRDMLTKDGFNAIYSSYGASDLDINLGSEGDDEVVIRKAIEKNSGLARELYGPNKGLPMVFHYDPMNAHVECNNNQDDTNELIFTITRDDRSSPRIRYNLGDKGRVYASSDVQALLTKHGIFHKVRSPLPLMFVWGRDATVVFNGANLDFTELERAVSDIDIYNKILKKAFYHYVDPEDGSDKLEFWLELNNDIEMFSDEEMQSFSKQLISKLVSANQDFYYQIDQLGSEACLPVVRFFKRGESPISDAGGHRKQVLVFNKQNLAEGYVLPSDKNICAEVALSKNALLQQTMSMN